MTVSCSIYLYNWQKYFNLDSKSSFSVSDSYIAILLKLHFVLKSGHFIHQMGGGGLADPSDPPLDPLLWYSIRAVVGSASE